MIQDVVLNAGPPDGSSSHIQDEHYDLAAQVSTRKLHLETGFYHRPKYESHKDGLYGMSW